MMKFAILSRPIFLLLWIGCPLRTRCCPLRTAPLSITDRMLSFTDPVDYGLRRITWFSGARNRL